LTEKRRVLFLCTGNSCRSQMAEAVLNARLGDHYQAYSAGTHPTGLVHPLAIKALAEIGIQHQGSSKHVDAFRGQSFDYVITLCDPAADECPVWLGRGKRMHMPFPDPTKKTGTEDEQMAAFREVRDGIATQISELLAE
jgi:arsenate reductase